MMEKLFYDLMTELSLENQSASEALLKMMIDELDTDQLYETSCVLFVAGEYGRCFGDTAYVDQEKVRIGLNKIVDEWQAVKAGIHELEVLGSVYGGLRSMDYYLRDSRLGEVIKELKWIAYDNYVSEGMLCHDAYTKALSARMFLACVPFGLFEPEDLVLVEAVDRFIQNGMIEDGPSTEAMYFLAYLLERGDGLRFIQLFDRMKAVNKTDLDKSMYMWIDARARDCNVGKLNQISHRPDGHNNPYEPQPDERYPKIICEGDTVRICATVMSGSEVPMTLTYKVNGGDEITREMTYDGISYSAEIDGYEACDQIDYVISNPYDRTELFSYTINRTMVAKRIRQVAFEDGMYHLTAEDESGDLLPVIKLVLLENGLFVIGQTEADTNVPSEWKEYKDQYVFCWEGMTLTLTKESPRLTLCAENREIMATEACFIEYVIDREDRIQKVQISLQSDESRRYYGFGERYNHIEQTGHQVDAYVYNQYKDQDLKTYIPIPLMMSDGYGTYSDTECYSVYDMSDSGKVYVSWEGASGSLFVFAGSMKDQLGHYYSITGQPVMIPKWAFGPWMSSNNWDSQAEVEWQMNKTLAEDMPSTVLVIEAWSDEATYYIFNDAYYDDLGQEGPIRLDDFEFPEWGRWPDPKGMTDSLHDKGIKLMLWQIPVIKQITSLNHPRKDQDEAYALDKSLVVKNADDSPYRIAENWFKDSLVIDFSNPEANKWWFDKRSYLLEDLGIDAFKTDGGECIFGHGLKFADGRSGKEMRNAYPNDYIRAYYEFLNSHKDGITFSRAGYSGAHTIPTHWAGDERSTFAAFRRNLIAGLNAAISGIVFWGWDLAGFSGPIPSADLFKRSTQMAAFCPIMQYHAESKAEFNQDRTPWNIAERTGDQGVMDLYRFYAHLRMNLVPYIYNESLKAVEEGKPLMMPMVMAYEEDTACHHLVDQYMFGDSLLIAPILEENTDSREVYLPEGEWYHFFRGEHYEGGKTYTVTCEGHEFPVFQKAGSMIPLNLADDLELGIGMDNTLDNYKNLVFKSASDNGYVHFRDDLGNDAEVWIEDGENRVTGRLSEPLRILV